MNIRSREMPVKYKRVIEMSCLQLISTDPPINQELSRSTDNLAVVEVVGRRTSNVRRGFMNGKNNPGDKKDRKMLKEASKNDSSRKELRRTKAIRN